MKSWTVHTITNKRNTSCGKFTGDGGGIIAAHFISSKYFLQCDVI